MPYILLSLLLLLSGCAIQDGTPTQIARSETLLEIGIPDWTDAEILVWEDTHGGFHGDGTLYAVIRFPDDRVEATLAQEWAALPMSDTLNWLVYGGTNEEGIGRTALRRESGEDAFPRVTRGYTLLIDRQARGEPVDEKAMLKRPSLNFSLALYDADTRTLYFYALDT